MNKSFKGGQTEQHVHTLGAALCISERESAGSSFGNISKFCLKCWNMYLYVHFPAGFYNFRPLESITRAKALRIPNYKTENHFASTCEYEPHEHESHRGTVTSTKIFDPRRTFRTLSGSSSIPFIIFNVEAAVIREWNF